MGCNSHLAIEYKEEDDSYWRGWGINIAESRWYTLYNALAGVRGNGECKPKTANRGRPEDISYEGKHFYQYCDAYIGVHSETWLLQREFKNAYDSVADNKDDSEWNTLDRVLTLLGKRYGPKNVRLLICFDN